MNDVYKPGLEEKIQAFLKRKAVKYPELHLLDGQGQDSIRPVHKEEASFDLNLRRHKSPRHIVQSF